MSYAGLGANTPAGVTPAQVRAKADAAVSAVLSASPTQLRAGISAVRMFQQVWGQGLTVDGIYGPATRAALVTVTGRQNLPLPPGSVPSGGGGGGGGGSGPAPSALPTTTEPETSGEMQQWLVPAAVVTTLVVVAGIVIMRRRRPVAANRRRRMRRNTTGAWTIPKKGSSRFKTMAEAKKLAKFFKTTYGHGVFDAKVVKEPSRSRPGASSYQVYIKPLRGAFGP